LKQLESMEGRGRGLIVGVVLIFGWRYWGQIANTVIRNKADNI